MCHFIPTLRKPVSRFTLILENQRRKSKLKRNVVLDVAVHVVDIEQKEDIDYREVTLLSLYDRVEKSQAV